MYKESVNHFSKLLAPEAEYQELFWQLVDIKGNSKRKLSQFFFLWLQEVERCCFSWRI